MFQAAIWDESRGGTRRLGSYGIAEKAALAYSKALAARDGVGAVKAAAAAARKDRRGKWMRSLTAEAAVAAAQKKGLAFARDAKSNSGYRGVRRNLPTNKFQARVYEKGPQGFSKQRSLGTFDTAKGAAFAYAREMSKLAKRVA